MASRAHKRRAARRRRQRRARLASEARAAAAAKTRTTGASMKFLGAAIPKAGATPGTGGARTRLAEMARKRLSGAREARRKEKKPVSEF